MSYAMKSKSFQNQRLKKAANDHAFHIKRDNKGNHVVILQNFLVASKAYSYVLQDFDISDQAAIGGEFANEFGLGVYGVVTERIVFKYKELREIFNASGKIDGIVGVLTMRAMDSHQQQLEIAPPSLDDRMQSAKFAPSQLKTLIVAGSHANRRPS